MVLDVCLFLTGNGFGNEKDELILLIPPFPRNLMTSMSFPFPPQFSPQTSSDSCRTVFTFRHELTLDFFPTLFFLFRIGKN